jgi:hypothetical protein
MKRLRPEIVSGTGAQKLWQLRGAYGTVSERMRTVTGDDSTTHTVTSVATSQPQDLRQAADVLLHPRSSGPHYHGNEASTLRENHRL